jgi:hypothetical protein
MNIPNIPEDNRILWIFVFLFWLVAFLIVPHQLGSDFRVLHNSAGRVLAGDPLYGVLCPYPFIYPHWVGAMLAPFGMISFNLSLSIIIALSVVIGLMLLERWNGRLDITKSLLFLLSPPALAIFCFGQIDLIVLGGLLLPMQFRALAALSKPQVACGALMTIPASKLFRAGTIVMVVGALSLLFINPTDIYTIPAGQSPGGEIHNLWYHLAPVNMIFGAGLLLWGMRIKSECVCIAASPFCVPYAAVSSFVGLWLVLLSWLPVRWSALLLAAVWLVLLV